MPKNYFAGRIIEKQDIAELDDDKGAVLNITLETELVNELLDIPETVSQRIVAFKADALRADHDLKEGDYVILTDCTRSPREFETKKRTKVETVDLVLRRFAKVTKAKFPEMLEKIKDRMFTLSDLEFTSADAEVLKAVAAEVSTDDLLK